jgi:hypothetical protein
VFFEPNRGQVHPAVEYLARVATGTYLFAKDGVTLQTPSPAPIREKGLDASPALPLTTHTVRLEFVDPSPQTALRAGGRLPGRIGYLLDNDPSAWVSDVPTFAHLRYEQLYEGVDLSFDGTRGAPRSTYVLDRGADSAAIRWRYLGAESVGLRPNGGLRLALGPGAGGAISEPPPAAWQDIRGERVPVEVRFTVDSQGTVGFDLGNYERSAALTIASEPAPAESSEESPGGKVASCAQEAGRPCFAWSTFLGSGIGSGHRMRLGVDAMGNVYVGGNTACACFPTEDPIQGTSGSFFISMFVSKFDPTGSTLLYSTYFGGPEGAVLRDMEVAPDGSVYIAGDTTSDSYPVTPGAYQPTFAGGGNYGDAVVTKLVPGGQQLEYSTYVGGSSEDGAWSIEVDETGSAVVAGWSSSPLLPDPSAPRIATIAYPTSIGAYQPLSRSPLFADAVVTKLNATGTSLVWSTGLGGSSTDYAHQVELGTDGSAYVTGLTSSGDFPTTADAWQPQQMAEGQGDVFVSRIAASGTDLLYSTFVGGSQEETFPAIVPGEDGVVYTAGSTFSTDFPTTPGAFQETSPDDPDAVGGNVYVVKLGGSGQATYSTYLGGSGTDGVGAGALAVDAADRVHVAGVTASLDFPTTQDALQPGLAGGGSDAFLGVLEPSGGGLAYSSFLGGGQPISSPCTCFPEEAFQAKDDARALILAPGGDVLVAGLTYAPDFPTTAGSYKPGFTGTASRWAKDRSEVYVSRMRILP